MGEKNRNIFTFSVPDSELAFILALKAKCKSFSGRSFSKLVREALIKTHTEKTTPSGVELDGEKGA